MKRAKTSGRLAARRRAWDAAKLDAEKMHEDRGASYTKRPGSNKKCFPRGVRKSHRERAA